MARMEPRGATTDVLLRSCDSSQVTAEGLSGTLFYKAGRVDSYVHENFPIRARYWIYRLSPPQVLRHWRTGHLEGCLPQLPPRFYSIPPSPRCALPRTRVAPRSQVKPARPALRALLGSWVGGVYNAARVGSSAATPKDVAIHQRDTSAAMHILRVRQLINKKTTHMLK